ncbi:hypothetical protein HHK36_030977 [Tetracentron sinense]|uniref:FAD dependent oxidoreductase domain-containing protein n=1 Tax=Tetracentron sinense TaxID=13715 RepID=A0A834YDU6_TETSI|nr:hypothetical protein HHK36_030977 [Tetracentron sinense]
MEQAEQQQKVVVCGGGVIGVCTAYFLAKKGAAVTLVEKSLVACAATGKTVGLLALDWCEGGPLSSLARASFNLHRSLALELDGPQAYGYRPLHILTEQLYPIGSIDASSSLASWVRDGKRTDAAEIDEKEKEGANGKLRLQKSLEVG